MARAGGDAERISLDLTNEITKYILYHTMKTTVINIKTKPIVKIRAQQIQDEPSEYLLQALQEAEDDFKKGKIISFKDPNDAVAYVGSLIKKK